MALTAKEAVAFANLAEKLEWPMPLAVFRALAPRIKTIPVELGIFRGSMPMGTLEVLLTQRPIDDPEFTPGAWHMPGTPMYPRESVSKTLIRLKQNEGLGGFTEPCFIGFVDSVEHDLAPIRPMMALLHIAEAHARYQGEGRFFRITKLPHNMLHPHRVFLARMVEFIKTGERPN